MAQSRRSSRLPDSPSALRKRQKDRIGLILIGAAIAAMLGIGYLYQSLDRTVYDPATGCPDSGALTLTVVMIDGSDPIEPRQQAFLRNHLEAVKQDIPRGGALEVYRLGTETRSLLEPVVSVCNPGRASDVSPFTESPRRAQRLWDEVFQGRLQGVFDTLLNPAREEWSPIFESIQSIGITAFARPEWQRKPRSLILISDMLQYTSGFSNYQSPGDFEKFRKGEYYRRLRTDLSNVEVTVFYIPRATRNDVQGSRHLDFWKAYFLDQGARPGRLAMFVHVEG